MPRLSRSDPAVTELAQLLHRRTGLTFTGARRNALEHGVAVRMAATGHGAPGAYLALAGNPAGTELQLLVDEVTIPETHFFRNPPQFRALRGRVLPELVAAAARGSRPLRVWSAGCSTGEEAYSLAVSLLEARAPGPGPDLSVLGTDVSGRALAAARSGRYGARSLQQVPPATLARWFVPDRPGGHRVGGAAREIVEFRQHNLVADPPPAAPAAFDLVLCRNVTIYFDRATTVRVIGRFHDCLRPGGYLVLGHAETLWRLSDAFDLVGLGDAFFYRRRHAGRMRAPGGPGRGAAGAPARPAPPALRSASVPAPPRVPAVPRAAAAGRTTAQARAGLRLPQPRAAGGPAGPPAGGPARPAGAGAGRPDPCAAARQAIGRGDYPAAARLAAAAADAEPLRVEPHYLCGLASAGLGADADAARSLRRAVYLDPAAAPAHFLLAAVLARLGRPEQAASAYRAAAAAFERPSGRPLAGITDGSLEALAGRAGPAAAALCRHLADRLSSRTAGRTAVPG